MKRAAILIGVQQAESLPKLEAVWDGVPPIELVDGEDLVDLFESLELGLTPRKAFDVDEAFFAEFRRA